MMIQRIAIACFLLAAMTVGADATVVSGVVRFEGEPLPGVVLNMRDATGSREQVTGVDGRYRLECPPGATCTLSAELEGLQTAPQQICLNVDQVELDINMFMNVVTDTITCNGETPMPIPVEVRVRGSVTDSVGTPILGAVVWLDAERYRGCRQERDGTWGLRELVPQIRTTTQTDQTGDFLALLYLVGPLRVTVSAPGHQEVVRRITLDADRELSFVLLPACGGVLLN